MESFVPTINLPHGTCVIALEHAPYEKPCYIQKWFSRNNIPFKEIAVWKGEVFPEPEEVALLVIMGGPMNIYEHEDHPWLIGEKRYIQLIIEKKIPVLGICLGGQLISDVLGGSVKTMERPEYGWCEIWKIKSLEQYTPIHSLIPDSLEVFQWHNDTFSIPPDAIPLYSSKNCQNQGFVYQNRVLAFQFHPELEDSDIMEFMGMLESDPTNGKQNFPIEEIKKNLSLYKSGNMFIEDILAYLICQNNSRIY